MKIFGIAGYSGAGKTQLITRLLPVLQSHRLRVSVIKQTHHDVQWDKPGKDSFQHTLAGAQEVILATPHRWMLSHELRETTDVPFVELACRFNACDLVLVEGFRHADLPKLEVNRVVTGHPWLYPQDAWVVGVTSDRPVDNLPWFALDDYGAISDFVWEHARYVEC